MSDADTSPTGDDLRLLGDVKWYAGRTTFSAKPCALEWTSADHIRLVELDKKTEEPVSMVFDAPVSALRVKRMRGTAATLVFTVGDDKYKVDYASKANLAIGVGGLIGRAASGRIIAKSDLPAWLAALGEAGVLDS